MSDRVQIVEMGPRDVIFSKPRHPYTLALISAIPHAGERMRERHGRRITLQGDPPNPADPPSGCRFRTRCWKATDLCARVAPDLASSDGAHIVACHHPEPAPQ